MDPREYLEKIAAAGYKSEIEQEENVVRSLPFVAAALAVLATVLSFARSYLPEIRGSVYPIFVYGTLIFLGLTIFLSILFLFMAIRARRYQYLSSGAEFQAYMEDLMFFYQNSGLNAQEIEERVVVDMRGTMIDQYI